MVAVASERRADQSGQISPQFSTTDQMPLRYWTTHSPQEAEAGRSPRRALLMQNAKVCNFRRVPEVWFQSALRFRFILFPHSIMSGELAIECPVCTVLTNGDLCHLCGVSVKFNTYACVVMLGAVFADIHNLLVFRLQNVLVLSSPFCSQASLPKPKRASPPPATRTESTEAFKSEVSPLHPAPSACVFKSARAVCNLCTSLESRADQYPFPARTSRRRGRVPSARC